MLRTRQKWQLIDNSKGTVVSLTAETCHLWAAYARFLFTLHHYETIGQSHDASTCTSQLRIFAHAMPHTSIDIVALKDVVEVIPLLWVKQIFRIREFTAYGAFEDVGIDTTCAKNMTAVKHHGTATSHECSRSSLFEPFFLGKVIAPCSAVHIGRLALLIAEASHDIELTAKSCQHRLYARTVGQCGHHLPAFVLAREVESIDSIGRHTIGIASCHIYYITEQGGIGIVNGTRQRC